MFADDDDVGATRELALSISSDSNDPIEIDVEGVVGMLLHLHIYNSVHW